MEARFFIRYFFIFAVFSLPGILLSNPYEIAWQNLDEFVASTRRAYTDLGPDQVAALLRKSGITPQALESLRQYAKQSGPDGKIKISLPFTISELKESNLRLARSGFDFIELDAAVTPSPLPDDVPQAEVIRYQTYLKWRKYIAPLVAFSTAVMIGAWMVNSGQVGNTVSGVVTPETPSMIRKMLPFIGMGGISAFLQHTIYQPWFKSHLFNRQFGVWARLGRDMIFPILAATMGYLLANLPPSPIGFTSYGSLMTNACLSFFLSAISVQAAELAIEKLRKRGLISHSQSVFFEIGSDSFGNTSRLATLNLSSVLGPSIYATYAVLFTIPLWFKISIGDRVYDWYTKKLVTGEAEKLSAPVRACAYILGQVSRMPSYFINLRRKRR